MLILEKVIQMHKKAMLSTTSLLSDLKNESNLNSFLTRNESSFLSQSISRFFDEMLDKYHMDKKEFIRRADIDRSYGYQLLRCARYASRDNYLKLAIGIGMDLADTQLLLNLTETSPLYVKVKRDAAIIFCIERRFDLSSTQELLYNQNLKILE